MTNVAGYTQMGAMPAAAGARGAACGQPALALSWLADAKSTSISTFVDVPNTHRHRRPWGTS